MYDNIFLKFPTVLTESLVLKGQGSHGQTNEKPLGSIPFSTYDNRHIYLLGLGRMRQEEGGGGRWREVEGGGGGGGRWR